MKKHNSPADGNCLFHSIEWSLASYDGVGKAELRERLLPLGMCLGDPTSFTHTAIRTAAYTCFVLPHPFTDFILGSWITYYTFDKEMSYHFRHVAPMAGKSIVQVTPQDRQKVFQNCMQSTTWGDETVLNLLEKLMGVRFMVVRDKKLVVRSCNHGDGFKPIVYVPLFMEHEHFSSITLDGKSAFAEAELPNFLVDLSHRDCYLAKEPYINLAHLPGSGKVFPRAPSAVSAGCAAGGDSLSASEPSGCSVTAAINSSELGMVATSQNMMEHFMKCTEAVAAFTQGDDDGAASGSPTSPYDHALAADGGYTVYEPDSDDDCYSYSFRAPTSSLSAASLSASACSKPHVEPVEEDLVVADGGLGYAGVMPREVTRLQCGVAVRTLWRNKVQDDNADFVTVLPNAVQFPLFK